MVVMDLLEFSGTFVYSARMFIDEGPGLTQSIFTSRQSQAIGSLGTARILRTGDQLGLRDLVELAVITSPPKAQKYAEMIAFRILLGDERELFNSINQMAKKQKKERKQQIKPSYKPHRRQNNPINVISELDLDHILKLLNLNSSIKHSKIDDSINYLNSLENELFHNLPEDNSSDNLSWAQKRVAFDIIGGRKGVLDQEIKSHEELIQKAKNQLTRSIPYIQDDGLVNAAILDQLEDIKELTLEDHIKQQIEGLKQMMEPFNSKKTSELIDTLSERELEKINNLTKLLENKVEQLKLDPEEFIPSNQRIREAIEDKFKEGTQTIDDIAKRLDLFKSGFSYDEMKKIVENSLKTNDDPLDLISKATEIDNQLQTNFADKLSMQLEEELDKLSFDDLVKNPVNHPSWLDQVDKKVEEMTKNKQWDDLWNTSKKLEESMEHSANNYIRNQLDNLANSTFQDQLDVSKTGEQLKKSVEWGKDKGLSVKSSEIREKGKKLGLSDEEIAKLIGEAFEILKMMIENDNPSFERMNLLIPAANLADHQSNQLINQSIKNEAEGALGGFFEHNTQQVLDSIGSSKKNQELMEKAIGAGAGENLLKLWYMYGNTMPPWMREMVKQLAKQIMIDQGKKRAAMLMGSSEAGPLPDGSIRPYNIGDDPDTIDLEESLENILSLGKSIDQVRADDLIVRKTVTGRRCVIFLIDISGSMSGQPLASAAMATVMLLYAFARDELGIALFESSTHVICEINQPVNIDEIADQILDLRARGGTQMQAALAWAEKQFVKSKSEDKMFLMITDAMIGDFDRSAVHLRNIADQGATSVLCMPAMAYGLGNIQNIVNASQSQLVTIKDWKNFPDQVSEILSRS